MLAVKVDGLSDGTSAAFVLKSSLHRSVFWKKTLTLSLLWRTTTVMIVNRVAVPSADLVLDCAPLLVRWSASNSYRRVLMK